MKQECDETKRNFAFRKKWLGKVLRCKVPCNFRLSHGSAERPNFDTEIVEEPVIAIQEVQRRKRNPTGSVIIQASPGIGGEVIVLPDLCQIISSPADPN